MTTDQRQRAVCSLLPWVVVGGKEVKGRVAANLNKEHTIYHVLE
jgi:hypothetical protein